MVKGSALAGVKHFNGPRLLLLQAILSKTTVVWEDATSQHFFPLPLVRVLWGFLQGVTGFIDLGVTGLLSISAYHGWGFKPD